MSLKESDSHREQVASASCVTTMPGFLAHPTRHLFFTGRGGVGKTSLSAVAALAGLKELSALVTGHGPVA